MTIDYIGSHLGHDTISEDSDYRRELQQLIKVLKGETPAITDWNFSHYTEVLISPRPTLPIIKDAVAAASLGFEEEVNTLIKVGLAPNYASLELATYINERCQQSLRRAYFLLNHGAPRSEVAEHLENTVAIFGKERMTGPVFEYIADLKAQVADFPRLMRSTVEAPRKLPVPERAAYYLDRFPEIKSLGGMEKTLEDEVVALGVMPYRPASIISRTEGSLARSIISECCVCRILQFDVSKK